MAGKSSLSRQAALLLLVLLPAHHSAGQTPHAARPGDDVQGAYVAALQHALPAHGYRAGPPTGKLDPTTERAIRAFQADNGLVQDTADAAALKVTLDRLTYGHKGAPAPTQPDGARGTANVTANSTARNDLPPPALAGGNDGVDRASSAAPSASVTVPIVLDENGIRQLQDGLRSRGYDLQSTGKLDIYTENAIKAFQLQNNLPEDGRIDGILLELLKR